jgi:hypothetical protein
LSGEFGLFAAGFKILSSPHTIEATKISYFLDPIVGGLVALLRVLIPRGVL